MNLVLERGRWHPKEVGHFGVTWRKRAGIVE
jgi:hypothetical protein